MKTKIWVNCILLLAIGINSLTAQKVITGKSNIAPVIIGDPGSATTTTVTTTKTYDRKGKDVALLFAVEDYEGLQALNKPIDGALKLKDILENTYGFKVEMVKNPDRKTIRAKLKEYQQKYSVNQLDRNGQLLVLFTGHGFPGDYTGFFVPKDGDESDMFATCFAYNDMRSMIAAINVKHKFVIVDACHSAYLNPEFNKSGPVFDNPKKLSAAEKEIAQHNANKSFEYVTSDAVGKTTPDNSQLMAKLLEGLKHADAKYGFVKLDALAVNYFKYAVPQPYYGRFEKGVGKTSFIFFKK